MGRRPSSSNASRPACPRPRETRGCAVGNPVVVFLSPLGSTALSSEVSGGACLSHHPQSLGCSSWAFVEPLSGEPWVGIEMVTCRGKVTHWPLSVTGENALPVAKQSGVRPRAHRQIPLPPSCRGRPGRFPSELSEETLTLCVVPVFHQIASRQHRWSVVCSAPRRRQRPRPAPLCPEVLGPLR